TQVTDLKSLLSRIGEALDTQYARNTPTSQDTTGAIGEGRSAPMQDVSFPTEIQGTQDVTTSPRKDLSSIFNASAPFVAGGVLPETLAGSSIAGAAAQGAATGAAYGGVGGALQEQTTPQD